MLYFEDLELGVSHFLGSYEVTRDEVLAALRNRGAPALEQVHAVVLETDGTLSVLQDAPASGATALASVPQDKREGDSAG